MGPGSKFVLGMWIAAVQCILDVCVCVCVCVYLCMGMAGGLLAMQCILDVCMCVCVCVCGSEFVLGV
jgi:hypothetical protein